MRWLCCTVLLISAMLVGSASAADHVFERTVIKGVGYRSHELFSQTQAGYAGQKLSERIMGTGSFDDRTEFETDRLQNSINFTQDYNYDYFPISYDSVNYDMKGSDRLCVINYDSGAVFTEAYTNVEHLDKSTEIRTIGNGSTNVLEAQINSNVIGVAHIGWVSRDNDVDSKGRHDEWGRSVEDLTGVFSINKYVSLMKNSSDSYTLTDWLSCV